MADFTFEFEFRSKRFQDADQGLRAFAQAMGKGIDRAGPVLGRELRKYLDTVAEAMAQRHGGSWPGGTTDKTLSRRSGKLVQAIRDSVEVTGSKIDDVQGRIGARGIPYGRIHEFGGVITAKNAKFLTIPLPAALNADGTPKKRSARDWDKTFVATSKAGNLIIFRREGKSVVPLYVLKTSVKIPPRLGLIDTLQKTLPYFVDTAMDAMLKELRNG